MAGFWIIKLCKNLPGGGQTRLHLSAWRTPRTNSLGQALSTLRTIDITGHPRYNPADTDWFPCVWYMASPDEVTKIQVLNKDSEEGPIDSLRDDISVDFPTGYDGVPVHLSTGKKI